MTQDKPHSGAASGGSERRTWHPARPIGLARALHKAGYGTRKQTEMMVTEGRVQIGDEVITDPRHMALPGAEIFLDGAPLRQLALRYFALHKPIRVICGDEDPSGRRLIQEYFPRDVSGLAAAGRMDGKTTGLILFSNDTAWNNMITTTKGLEQEYRLQVEGELRDPEISVMSAGVLLPKLGLCKPESVRIVEVMNGQTVVHMTVRDGKIRLVRRMLTTLRHKVLMVRRVRIGEIRLGDLPVGGRRELSGPEIASVRELYVTLNWRRGKTGG
jgi:pseudouridine synthase